ncbi:hypothetical protein GCM10010885_08950 [Alicyclobacillus cellulosilyticus]|uniref:Peptidase S54 rhomboid domain-containing protein n=1 Tax=Alicyclobacillus cellulosilyticus TaxID=1003997 RepID=A0A917NHX4_9BACL|nr:rhomboid family intramembrane serine protease [Alicyclobacillus cellulosilyticus]GGJ01940.1 hypothetical protein GCM10010885_08950 [Alicyclobacillus cellulosilyticus]
MRWRRLRDRPMVRRASQAPVAWTLIFINVVWFFTVEAWTGLSPEGTLRAGALYAPAVAAGEWYRLVSDMFVHMSLLHLMMNMISLASLAVMEVLLGSAAFFALYWLAGVAGSLVSLVFLPDGVVGGASAAIFGVFGAALMLALRGVLSRAARNQLLALLIVNLVYGWAAPNVAVAAHLGGLVAGAGLAWPLYAGWFPRTGVRAMAVLCAGFTAVALGAVLA